MKSLLSSLIDSFRFHLSPISSNVKTGPIPVSTTEKRSCPSTCPFLNSGCYASVGQLNFHWNAVSFLNRFVNHTAFLKAIKALPFRAFWRHNQAGDLPHANGTIILSFLKDLVSANRGKRGFTYTHHDCETNKVNALAIAYANDNGFTVNLSGNNERHAIKLKGLGIAPVVTIVESTETRKTWTVDGNKFLRCPATYGGNRQITCATCQLCQNGKRDFIVAFPSHGISKAKVDKAAREGAI